MATRWPQKGQRGLERGLTLGYWPFRATFAKEDFWSESSFYEKSRQRRKKEKKQEGKAYHRGAIIIDDYALQLVKDIKAQKLEDSVQ